MHSIRFVPSIVFLALTVWAIAPTAGFAAAAKAPAKSAPAGPVKQSELDAPVTVTKQVSLIINDEMAREIFDAHGLTGELTLSFVVDKEGKPKSIKVESGVGKVTDKAAVTAISKWRFKPAKKNGVIVEVRIVQPMKLILPNGYVPTYDSILVEVQPFPLNTPQAIYPASVPASANLINPSATVRFTVDSTGRTKNISASSSAGTAFSNAARDAVALWRYRPGEVKGEPVNTQLQVEVYFSGR